MVANIFTTVIIQPIFNLLVFIYAIIPGHNFGLAIILFTLVIRLLMWPMVKKQINQAQAMRELAPELKKIKAASKGDRQKEAAMTMELYKEREINPWASLGVMVIQIPILLALYSALRRIINNPHQVISFSYPFVHHLSWLQTVAHNISRFDNSLFGAVNLTRTAVGSSGIYWPAMIIVIGSAIAQYFVAKQLMPSSPESKGLRQILSEASSGKQADSSEMNAAVSRNMQYFIPFMVLLVSLRLAAALPLYWLVGSVIAYIQQAIILRRDVAVADASVKTPQLAPKPQPKAKPKKRGRR